MTTNDGNNNLGDSRGWSPDYPPEGEDEILRSGQGGDEEPPEHSGAGEVSGGSAAGEARRSLPFEFRTYRYKGCLPSGRLILGREILAAVVAGIAVYVSLFFLLVMAELFGILVEFLDTLAERGGMFRLELVALLAFIYVLFCRSRFRLAWRKHLLGEK